MRRVSAMILASTLAGLVGGGPAVAARVANLSTGVAPSRARAWVLHVSVPGQDVLQFADASSEGGAAPSGTGAPLAAGGQSQWRATATTKAPDSVTTPLVWSDSTGSGAAEGAFAEAHVLGDSADVRTGIGSLSGTGFPIANKTLTWDQQVQLMDSWISTNAQVFDPLNAEMAALAPVLAPAGIRPPHFEPMAGLGWIDVMKMRQIAANTRSSSSPDFASARATASAAEVWLLGGFIQARGIAADAVSESAAGTDSRDASARIDSLRIAGVEVKVHDGGFRVAGNDVVSRAVVQPALDVLLTNLKAGGMTIRPALTSALGDLREATALSVELASPQGSVLVSLGYASASAASVGSSNFDLPIVRSGPTPEPTWSSEPAPTIEPIPDYSQPAVESSTPAGNGGTNLASGQTRRYVPPQVLSAETVRSLRTSYLLLFIVGGIIGAVIMPLLARAPSAPSRRRIR